MTHFLTALLILVILGSIGGGVYFIQNDPVRKQIQATPRPAPSVETIEEKTAKLCGPLPDDLTAIEKNPFITVDNLSWAPGCDSIGWSITWKVAKDDPRAEDLPQEGIYLRDLPDKKTVQVPLPEKHIRGSFGGWYSDHEMTILARTQDGPTGAWIYDIQSGQYRD